MGKKTRKTRWRTLAIADDQSDSEESNTTFDSKVSSSYQQKLYHRKYSYSSQSTPIKRYQEKSDSTKSTRSSSTASENKIIFNEDEYTRITTPRQDVLFKKGYLNKPKTYQTQTSTGNSTTSTGNSTGNGTPDHQSTDLEYESQFVFPNGFLDQNGIYYINGYDSYPVMMCNPPVYYADSYNRTKRYSTGSLTESASPNNEEATPSEQPNIGSEVTNHVPSEYNHVYNVVYPAFYYNGMCPPQETLNHQYHEEPKRVKRRRRRKTSSSKSVGREGTTSEYTDDESSDEVLSESQEQTLSTSISTSHTHTTSPQYAPSSPHHTHSDLPKDDNIITDSPSQATPSESCNDTTSHAQEILLNSLTKELSNVDNVDNVDTQSNKTFNKNDSLLVINGCDSSSDSKTETSTSVSIIDDNISSKIECTNSEPSANQTTTCSLNCSETNDEKGDTAVSKYNLKPDAQEFVPRSSRMEPLCQDAHPVPYIKFPPNFVPMPILNPMGEYAHGHNYNAFVPPGIPINFITPDPKYINYLHVPPSEYFSHKSKTVTEETKTINDSSTGSEVEEKHADASGGIKLLEGRSRIDIAKIVSKLEAAVKEQDADKDNAEKPSITLDKIEVIAATTPSKEHSNYCNIQNGYKRKNMKISRFRQKTFQQRRANGQFELSKASLQSPINRSGGTNQPACKNLDEYKFVETNNVESQVLVAKKDVDQINNNELTAIVEHSRNRYENTKRQPEINLSINGHNKIGKGPNSVVTSFKKSYHANYVLNNRKHTSGNVSETSRKPPFDHINNCDTSKSNKKNITQEKTVEPSANKNNKKDVLKTPPQWIPVLGKKKRKNKNMEVDDFSEEELEAVKQENDDLFESYNIDLLQDVIPSISPESIAEPTIVQTELEVQNKILKLAESLEKNINVSINIPEVSEIEKQLLQIEAVNDIPAESVDISKDVEDVKNVRKKSKKGNQKTKVKRVIITDIDLSASKYEPEPVEDVQEKPIVKIEQGEALVEKKTLGEVINEPSIVKEVETNNEIVSVPEENQKVNTPDLNEKRNKKKKKKPSKSPLVNSSVLGSNTTIHFAEDSYDFLLDNSFSNEAFGKTNLEVSQELDLIIQKGMYSNLEEKVKSIDIAPLDIGFFQNIIGANTSREPSIEKTFNRTPNYSKISSNNFPKFKSTMASVSDFSSDFVHQITSTSDSGLFVDNPEVTQILNDIYGEEKKETKDKSKSKVKKGSKSSKKVSSENKGDVLKVKEILKDDFPEVNGHEGTDEKNLYPITQAVKNWMNKTRENTPEVEILKSPSTIFKELSEIDDTNLKKTPKSEDSFSEDEIVLFATDGSRKNSTEPDLLECWENEIVPGRSDNKVNIEISPKQNGCADDKASCENDDRANDDDIEVYESKYGQNEDFLKLKAEIEEQKTNRNFPKHGTLPYRAICCSIM